MSPFGVAESCHLDDLLVYLVGSYLWMVASLLWIQHIAVLGERSYIWSTFELRYCRPCTHVVYCKSITVVCVRRVLLYHSNEYSTVLYCGGTVPVDDERLRPRWTFLSEFLRPVGRGADSRVYLFFRHRHGSFQVPLERDLRLLLNHPRILSGHSKFYTNLQCSSFKKVVWEKIQYIRYYLTSVLDLPPANHTLQGRVSNKQQRTSDSTGYSSDLYKTPYLRPQLVSASLIPPSVVRTITSVSRPMCSTTMISTDAPKVAGGLGRKRARDDGQGGSRPIKRVTFSNRDFVLGTAQEYDRSSAPIPASAFSLSSQNTCHGSSSDSGGSSQPKANFCGIWRRSHGFNWAALLKLSGVHQDAIPAQVCPQLFVSRSGVKTILVPGISVPSRRTSSCGFERFCRGKLPVFGCAREFCSSIRTQDEGRWG